MHDQKIEIEVKSFHGWIKIPVDGIAWQEHDAHYVSCHMTEAALVDMCKAINCPYCNCTCGGVANSSIATYASTKHGPVAAQRMLISRELSLAAGLDI